MKKNKICMGNHNKQLAKARKYIVKHSSTILKTIGIGALIGAVAESIHATPKAFNIIEHEKFMYKQQHNLDIDSKIKLEDLGYTPRRFFKDIKWKYYIPTALLTATSIGCIFGSDKIKAKEFAMLAAAYRLSEATAAEYKQKVIDTIGEKGEKELTKRITKDKIEKNAPKEVNISEINNGNYKCYDAFSDRFFYSNKGAILEGISDFNSMVSSQWYGSLNELYTCIGIDRHVSYGDILGWNGDDAPVKVILDSDLTINGEPFIVIYFENNPKMNFRDVF